VQRGTLKNAAVTGGLWMAWLLLVAAFLIPAPTAVFMLSFLAVSIAVLPLALGSTKQRIFAVTALLLAFLIAGSMVEKAKEEKYFKLRQKKATPSAFSSPHQYSPQADSRNHALQPIYQTSGLLKVLLRQIVS